MLHQLLIKLIQIQIILKETKISDFFGKNKTYFVDIQEIEIINLSEFLLKKENKIDILKIDTEGYELNILKGISYNDFKKIKIYLKNTLKNLIKKLI